MKRKINLIVVALLVVAICATMFPIRSDAVSYDGSSSYKSGKYYTALTNVQLTGNQRTDIVNVAKSQIGYQEGGSSGQYSGTVAGGNNYTEYGRWYGSYVGVSWYNSVQWCAMFVSWCAYNAGISESIVDYDQYTETQVQHFKNQGRAHKWSSVQRGEYTPLPGDIVYFLSSSGAASGRTVNHVGIVTGFSNNTLYTIEGNTSSAYFATDGGCCSDKTYDISSSRVVYICSPNYTTGDSLGGLYNENDFIPSNVQGVVFDPEYYAAKNPDVAKDAYYGKNETNLYDHFINNGFAEGRESSPIFNIKDYISQNPDLKAAFGGAATEAEKKENWINAVKHFGENGAFKDETVRYTAKSTSLEKDFYARIQLTNATLNLSLSETNVIAYTPSTAPAQIWHFEQQSDGSYKITNTKNSLVLDVAAASKNSGANIQIYESNDSNAQRWNIYETFKKDGSSRGYILRSVISPACVLTVASGSPAALDNVQNSTYASLDSQVFKFEITQVVETTPGVATSTPSEAPTQIPTQMPTQAPTTVPTAKPTETVVYPCVQTQHDAYAISTITSTTGYYLQSVTLDKSWVGIVFPGWAVNNDGTATFEVYAFDTDLATSVAGTALLSETISIKEIPENEHRFAKALPAGKYVFKISNLGGANPHFGIGDKATNIATDIAISEVAVSENFDPAVHALIINYITSDVAAEKPTSQPTAEPTAKPTSNPTVEPTAEPTSEPTDEPTSEKVLHVSRDEIRPDVICGNNEANISTPKLESGRTEATFWGWVALAKNIKSFSYSINGGAKVDQPSAVVEAEQPVLDAAATVDGAITASRFSVVVPVTEGTQKIEIFAEFEDGTSESFWVADLTVGEPTDNPSDEPTDNPSDEPSEDLSETIVYPCVQTHHDAYAISTITSTTGYYLQSVTLDKSWVGIVFPGWAVNNDGTATFEVYAFNTDLATSVVGTALLSETISIKEIPENEHRFTKALPAGKYVFKISNLGGANPHFGIGDKVTNIATDIAINEVAVSGNFDPAVHALIVNYITSDVAVDVPDEKPESLIPLPGSNVVINSNKATLSGISEQTTASNVAAKFEGANYIKVVDKNGNVLSGSALVGTGCKVQLADNGIVKEETTVVIKGEIDGNGVIDSDDAIYLLRNTLFAGLYPVVAEDDVDGNSKYDSDDAIHLLRYTLFPSLYPLK